MPGLVGFSYEANKDRHWAEWAHLSLISDQGSDMVSVVHCLEYCAPLQLVVTGFWT